MQVLHRFPTAPHRELGFLVTRESGLVQGSSGAIIARMRQDAAKRGCDAVVITASADHTIHSTHAHTTTYASSRLAGGAVTSSSTPSSRTSTTTTGSIQTMKGFRGVCIVFTGKRKLSSTDRRKIADRKQVSITYARGEQLLTTRIGDSKMRMTVQGAPAVEPDSVELRLELHREIAAATSDPEPLRLSGCQMNLELGKRGSLTLEQTEHDAQPSRESWRGVLSLAAVARVALADRAEARLCDFRFKIGAASRKKLGSFVREYRRVQGDRTVDVPEI